MRTNIYMAPLVEIDEITSERGLATSFGPNGVTDLEIIDDYNASSGENSWNWR